MIVAAQVEHDTLADLVRAPERFDHRIVSVTGRVVGAHTGRTTSGAVYTLVRVEDGGAAMVIVTWQPLVVSPGTVVRATGTFYDGVPFALAPADRPGALLDAALVVTVGPR